MIIAEALGIVEKILTMLFVLGLHGYASVKIPREELGKFLIKKNSCLHFKKLFLQLNIQQKIVNLIVCVYMQPFKNSSFIVLYGVVRNIILLLYLF